jgi:hypothetical protein
MKTLKELLQLGVVRELETTYAKFKNVSAEFFDDENVNFLDIDALNNATISFTKEIGYLEELLNKLENDDTITKVTLIHKPQKMESIDDHEINLDR